MSKVKIQGHSSGTGTVTITGPNTNSDRTLTIPDITGTAITSGDTGTVTQAIVHPDAVNKFISGRKNLIINGGFDVWQRGTSFSSPASYSYTTDRWKAIGTVTTVSQSANGLSITATSNDYFAQDIEARDVKAGNYIFSFTADDYSKINSIGCFSIGGGSHYGLATKISDGVYSINLAEANRAGTAVRLEFYLGVGTVVLSNVQLELGDQATDFEHRSYGEELALCQRYYQVVSLAANYIWYYTSAWGTSNTSFPFATVMRDSPTISYGFTTCTNAQPGGASGGSFGGSATTEHCRLTCSVASSYQQWGVSTVSGGDATKEVRFDAEL